MTARHAIVVGAGLSGLMAARTLTDHGWSVTIFDKGRGVGGRLATRRISTPDGRTAILDHGAQFFTVRDSRFASLVGEWLRAGVVREWCRGFGVDDGHPRYVANGGMTALAKHLANGLDVRTSNLVFAVKPGASKQWAVVIDDGAEHEADAVVMTCPLPQSYSLTVTTGHELPSDLLMTDYERTIGLLTVLDKPSAISAPGGLQHPDAVFSWIGDNMAKGVSPIPAVTFHANPEWSSAHWDDDAETGLAMLTEFAAPYLGDARIVASEYKKWRFATPKKMWPEPCYATADDTLVFAGDAFAGPKVEGAVLSGLAAGTRIADI